MRNILLVVAVVAMSFGAAAGEKNAPAKDAAAKSRATVRKEKTEDALSFIKEKSPRSYELVTNYLSIIQVGAKSGVQVSNNPPRFQVGEKTACTMLSWYASCIVHDAHHSKLYNDYRRKFNCKVPKEIYSGRKAEDECLYVQEDFYREINVPETGRYIKHLRNMRKVDYFSDYKNRDW